MALFRPSVARAAFFLVGLGLVAASACATGTGGADDPSDASATDATTSTETSAPRDGAPPSVATDGAPTGPRAPTAGEVIFSEMMINPDGVSDEFGEWVEVYNTTDAPLGLAGCHLADEGTPKDDRIVDTDVVVPAKSAIVLGRSANAATNGGLSGVSFAYGNGFVLANGGDAAILLCGGVEIDRVVFGSTWPFDKGATMQVKQSARTAAGNDSASGWCKATLSFGSGAQLGTPGNTQNHCP